MLYRCIIAAAAAAADRSRELYVTTYLHSPACPVICRCTTFDDDEYLYNIVLDTAKIVILTLYLLLKHYHGVHDNHLEAIRSLIWVFYIPKRTNHLPAVVYPDKLFENVFEYVTKLNRKRIFAFLKSNSL